MTNRVRKGPLLRALVKDWTELRDLDLDAGRFHVITLQLHRIPGPDELERLQHNFRKLLLELDDAGIKGVGMLLHPGEHLTVFELEKEAANGRRKKRKR